MINEPAFDLKGFVVFCYEEDGSLASLQDIAPGFVEEIIGHYQRILTKLADARNIDGIRSAVLINGGQDNGAISTVPGFTDDLR